MEHVKWIFSGVGVAVVSALLALMISRQRKASALRNAASHGGAVPDAVAHSALSQQKNFMGVHVRVSRRVAVGDFCELPIRKDYILRVTLDDIRPLPSRSTSLSDPTLGAELSFTSRWVHPGAHAIETGSNRFLVPSLSGMEETQCVYGFNGDAVTMYFFRICVPHINPQARTVDLDFVVLRPR